MADYILTFTDEKDAILTKVVASYNADYNESLTALEFLQLQADRQLDAAGRDDRRQRFNLLDDASQVTALIAGES